MTTEVATPSGQQLPADTLPEPAARVLRRFRSVFNAVKTHFQQVEKQAGIGGAQLWALAIIQASPDLGVMDLARAMDIHQTTASNLVRALGEQQLVDSARSPRDRRVSMLRVSPLGQQMLARAPAPFSGVLPAALAQMDASTLERLDADLAQLIALLQADPQAAQQPLAQLTER